MMCTTFRSAFLMLAALLVLVSADVLAHQQEVEELHEGDFEVLSETVEAPEGDGEAGERNEKMGLGKWMGRLHPSLVHFAVAWAFLMLPLALARTRRAQLGRLDLWVLVGAVAAAAAAVTTGLLHAPAVMGRPGIEPLVEDHEHAGIALLVLLSSALVVRVAMERAKMRILGILYVAILAAGAGLVLYVGHLGGGITYGTDFLF